jgi:hypothetical protein
MERAVTMDRITKTLIEDFLNLLELQSEGIANDFEKFVNYSILSKEYTKTFDMDTVTVASDVLKKSAFSDKLFRFYCQKIRYKRLTNFSL